MQKGYFFLTRRQLEIYFYCGSSYGVNERLEEKRNPQRLIVSILGWFYFTMMAVLFFVTSLLKKEENK